MSETTTEQQIRNAVAEGVADTPGDIADHLGLSKGHIQKTLKAMTDAGAIDRVRDGPRFRYVLPDEGEDRAAPRGDTADGEEDNGIMPASRNYDWSDADYHVDPTEYFATDGELPRLMAQIKHRNVTGQPVRALVSGETGTGKTTLSQTLAAWNESREDVVWVSVQFSKDMDDGDLLGVPTFAGDATMWVDGPVTKAFIAGTEGKTVHLHLDELNRAPPHVLNALFEALDHRGAIRLDGPRGGELISVDPLDIVVTATINEGDEYHGTERMDLAGKGRFTSKFVVKYLARKEPSNDDSDADGYVGLADEAELLEERRGVHYPLAERMVRAVADVRADASDAANTTVEWGIPTRAVLAWGGLAHGYALDGVDNPVMLAAQDAILEVYYGERGYEDMKDSVQNTLETHLDGAPWDPVEFEAWEADEVVRCSAMGCDYEQAKPAAEREGVTATMICPECGRDDTLNIRTK